MTEDSEQPEAAAGDEVPLGAVLEELDKQTADVAADTAADLLKLSRTPPSVLDCERATLGALLLSPACYDPVAETGLEAGEFYRPQHRVIYSTMTMLHAAGEPIDTLIIVEALRAQGKLDYVGGAAAIAALEALMPTPAHAPDYAKQIREKAKLRNLIVVGTHIVENCYAQHQSAADIISAAERDVLAVSKAQRTVLVNRSATLHRVLDDGIHGRKPKGLIPTGFKDLDPVLNGGFTPGQFILVAARPGMGKTSLALRIATYAADNSGPVALVTLEQNGDELSKRELEQESGFERKKWKEPEGGRAAVAAAARIENRPLHVVDFSGGATITQVCSEVRRLHSQLGIVLFVVDWLGKITPSDRYKGNKNNEVEQISDALDRLAGQLGIPCVACSQLNRAVEGRADKRPNKGDLRDSGALEQDADVIMFLHRPEYYLKENTPRELRRLAEVNVDKNRDGECTTVNLYFDGASKRFGNLQHGPAPKAPSV
jgi:replicative DNA helicase